MGLCGQRRARVWAATERAWGDSDRRSPPQLLRSSQPLSVRILLHRIAVRNLLVLHHGERNRRRRLEEGKWASSPRRRRIHLLRCRLLEARAPGSFPIRPGALLWGAQGRSLFQGKTGSVRFGWPLPGPPPVFCIDRLGCPRGERPPPPPSCRRGRPILPLFVLPDLPLSRIHLRPCPSLSCLQTPCLFRTVYPFLWSRSLCLALRRGRRRPFLVAAVLEAVIKVPLQNPWPSPGDGCCSRGPSGCPFPPPQSCRSST